MIRHGRAGVAARLFPHLDASAFFEQLQLDIHRILKCLHRLDDGVFDEQPDIVVIEYAIWVRCTPRLIKGDVNGK